MNQSNLLKAVVTTLLALCTICNSFGAGAKQTTLFRFPNQNTGIYPSGGVVVDASGVVYGTTHEGGAHNFGTVFKLVPPTTKDRPWTESVLYSFAGGNDGEYPYTLTLDGSGNLYGTASRGQYGTATVFELSPNGNTWTFSTIFSFDPAVFGNAYVGSPLIFDQAGNLYGESTQGGQNNLGFVYELTPAQHGGAWTGSIAYSFRGQENGDGASPDGGLAFDSNGNLYGVTTYQGLRCTANCQKHPCHVEGCGIVFQLQPPANKGRSWKENVLYSFQGKGDGGLPEGGVTVDTDGNLFGTTTVGGKTTGMNGLGVVFELMPLGNGRWVDKTIYAFQTLGSFHPYAGVVVDATGKLYGTTLDGGNLTKCFDGACGTVYQLVPPQQDGAWSFTVLHGFGGAPDGSFLVGTLFLQGGKLYGAAATGGDEKTQECKNAGGCGLVYQTTP